MNSNLYNLKKICVITQSDIYYNKGPVTICPIKQICLFGFMVESADESVR